jgi:adenylate kinase family enzyme
MIKEMKPTLLNTNSKIIVIGTSGAGKTTLAQIIAKKFKLKDIELDALFWEPGWSQVSPEIFRARISQAMSESHGWVVHGNYNKVRDLTWKNADTLIWLDYPRSIVLWRVFKRSVLRVLTREKLWAGNRESFRKTFLSRNSIIVWSWQTYSLRKKQYSELTTSNESSHLRILKFNHPNELDSFLSKIL